MTVRIVLRRMESPAGALTRRGTVTTTMSDTVSTGVADELGEMFAALFGGGPPVPLEFWDGSVVGAGGPGRVVIRRPDALRRIVWSPDELGIARAFVAGDVDLVGPVAPLLRALQDALPTDARIAAAALPKVLAGVRSVGALGPPLPPPPPVL